MRESVANLKLVDWKRAITGKNDVSLPQSQDRDTQVFARGISGERQHKFIGGAAAAEVRAMNRSPVGAIGVLACEIESALRAGDGVEIRGLGSHRGKAVGAFHVGLAPPTGHS